MLMVVNSMNSHACHLRVTRGDIKCRRLSSSILSSRPGNVKISSRNRTAKWTISKKQQRNWNEPAQNSQPQNRNVKSVHWRFLKKRWWAWQNVSINTVLHVCISTLSTRSPVLDPWSVPIRPAYRNWTRAPNCMHNCHWKHGRSIRSISSMHRPWRIPTSNYAPMRTARGSYKNSNRNKEWSS